MDPIEALEAFDAVDPVHATDAVLQLRVEPAPPTFATTSTGFDRWPAILDPAAASIAATAAAQDLRTFQLSQLLLRRRR